MNTNRFNIIIYQVLTVFLFLALMYSMGISSGLFDHTVSLQKELQETKIKLAAYEKDLILASEEKVKGLGLAESELNGFNSQIMEDLLEERIYTAIKKYRSDIDDGHAFEMSLAIIEASKQYNISVKLLLSMGHTESLYNPSAESKAGALGVLQVMPFWKDHIDFIKSTDDLNNSILNVRAGAYVLRRYLDKWDGDIEMALLSYNRGITKVKRLVANNKSPHNGYAEKILNKVHIYI